MPPQYYDIMAGDPFSNKTSNPFELLFQWRFYIFVFVMPRIFDIIPLFVAIKYER